MLHCCNLTNVLHVSAHLAHVVYTGLLSTSCSLLVRQGSARQMSKAARQHCSSSGRVRSVTTACSAWLRCCAVHLSNSRPAQTVVCGMQLSSLLCHCHWRLYNQRSRSACTGHLLHIFTVRLMPCCLTASSAASFKSCKHKATRLSASTAYFDAAINDQVVNVGQLPEMHASPQICLPPWKHQLLCDHTWYCRLLNTVLHAEACPSFLS